jgi:transposase
LKKYSILVQQNTGLSKLDEIKKLKESIEELEFVKDFQQDIIADMELITGVDMSKKSLPKTLAKEIALKKKNRLKEIGSISALGYLNKPSTNDSKPNKNNN